MEQKWIQIRIGKTFLNPVMIFNGRMFCHSNTMQTQSCTLNIPQRLVDVPIEFIYQEGNTPNGKEIYRESVNLSREKGVLNTLSMILGGNRVHPVRIDVYFNENEEGLCIGFLAPRFIPTKYVVKSEYWKITDEPQNKSSTVPTGKPAKEVFVNNYHKFGELLPITAAHADINIVIKWENVIRSIEDSDLLIYEFHKYVDNLDTWLKLLSSWGLKQDGCKQYPGMLINTDNYATDDMISIDEERNYKVLVPCWTMWIEENGKRREKLVSKGLVKAI